MKLCISVVLHDLEDVGYFLDNYQSVPDSAEVLVTINTTEAFELIAQKQSLPSNFVLTRRLRPLSFAANQNRAFEYFATVNGGAFWFLVVNPDLVCDWDRFNAGLIGLDDHCVFVPYSFDGGESSHSPRSISLFKRFVYRRDGFDLGPQEVLPPGFWMPGCFILFPASVFQALEGFDESYRLYFEDVDLFDRIGKKFLPVKALNHAVKHKGRRLSSSRVSYAIVHFVSLLKFTRRSIRWRL